VLLAQGIVLLACPARDELTLITMLHQHVLFTSSPSAFFVELFRRGTYETGRIPCNG
jgi:hypothetical protein